MVVVGGEGDITWRLVAMSDDLSVRGRQCPVLYRGYVLLSLSRNQSIRLTSYVSDVLSLGPQNPLYVDSCKVL